MSDLVFTAGIAMGLLGLVCFVAGLLGYVKPEVVWFPPDPDPVDYDDDRWCPQGLGTPDPGPVDEQYRTLPDLGPWLPADVDPRDEPWLHKGWYEQLHLEPTQVEQMLTDIESYLKERSQ